MQSQALNFHIILSDTEIDVSLLEFIKCSLFKLNIILGYTTYSN